jgi:nucleoside-diphosphate-sugar epimerase
LKILITGSAGFVGSHFARKLAEHELTLIDIKEGNDAGEFFRSNDTQYDLVIHAAATVGGRMVIDLAPHKLFNNFNLDSELFQWSLKTQPKKIMYFSSSAAYPMSLQGKEAYKIGNPKPVPNFYKLREEDIDLDNVESPDPSIYGWSKLTGEQLARYATVQGLNIYVFRPFSGYSESQDLDYPFPSFIARAKRRDNPFEIWGDGEQVRDWIHIDDIVNAAIYTLNSCEPGIWNVCSGRPTSFNEFASILTNMVGYSPKFDHKLGNPVGVYHRVGDPTKSHQVYTPRITLEEGIARALRV